MKVYGVRHVTPGQFLGRLPCSVYDKSLVSLVARRRIPPSLPASQMFHVTKYSQRIHDIPNVSALPAISFLIFVGFPNLYLQGLTPIFVMTQHVQFKLSAVFMRRLHKTTTESSSELAFYVSSHQ